MVWRDYRALFWLSRGGWPAHTISTHLQPFLFMSAHLLMDCNACSALGHHLLLKQLKLLHTSPLCRCLGKKITRIPCSKFYASSNSFIIYPLLSFFGKYWVRNYVYLILMKRKVLAKQTDSCKIKFDKKFIWKYICTSILCLLFWRWST